MYKNMIFDYTDYIIIIYRIIFVTMTKYNYNTITIYILCRFKN